MKVVCLALYHIHGLNNRSNCTSVCNRYMWLVAKTITLHNAAYVSSIYFTLEGQCLPCLALFKSHQKKSLKAVTQFSEKYDANLLHCSTVVYSFTCYNVKCYIQRVDIAAGILGFPAGIATLWLYYLLLQQFLLSHNFS